MEAPAPPSAPGACSYAYPSLDHTRSADWETVYEPSEDTFLMEDALRGEAAWLRSRFPFGCVFAELGPGSGYLSAAFDRLYCARELPGSSPAAAAARELGRTATARAAEMGPGSRGTFLVSVDVNPSACTLTGRTLDVNARSHHDQVSGDLLGCVREGFALDLLLFNPPYVPTPESEVAGGGIEASWAGGVRGRTVIDRLVPLLGSRLARPLGVLYLLLLDENDPDEVAQWVERECRMEAVVVVQPKRFRNERLRVIRFTAKGANN